MIKRAASIGSHAVVDRNLRAAVKEAVQGHWAAGRKVAVFRKGKVVLVGPDDEAPRLKAKKGGRSSSGRLKSK